MNKPEIVDRCLEIEESVNTMERPIINHTSSEDIDDAYQAMLEYREWLEELTIEYNNLNVKLGFVNRTLFPVQNRRNK